MTTVKIQTEQELVNLTAELLHVMVNMRHAQVYWHEHFGGINKKRKEHWEKRADELLTRHGVTEHSKTNNIQVFANPQK